MLLGADVSKWNGEMDWQRAADAGLKFAFVRAGSITTSGQCYMDYQFIRNIEMGPDQMPVGCYWYYRPQFSPQDQAQYFANLINPEEWLIPPVADIEYDGGLSPSAYANSIKAFLDEIEKQTDYKPIIYTSRSKWAFVEPRPYWPDYDLWVAHWTSNTTPLLPEGWTDWRFWQYTSGGDGPNFGAGSAHIDLNRFNGDQVAFDEYINKPPATPELPPEIGVKVDIEGVKYWGKIQKVED